MESRALFFSPLAEFLTNFLYLNEIWISDIFTLNDEPLLFLPDLGEPRDRTIGSSDHRAI